MNGSLKRLKTDYIDLYQLHWPERNVNSFGKLGYKHDDEHDRFLMEKKEIELLGELGVQNPYFYNVS